MVANLATKLVPAAESSDPLLAAINHFIFSGDAYDALPEDLSDDQEQAEFERLCNEPDRVLVNWRTPARTLESTVAAIRLALQEVEQGLDQPTVASLLRAALGFLEKRIAQ